MDRTWAALDMIGDRCANACDSHFAVSQYRLRGSIEVYGVGKEMLDVVMATLAAQIEW